MARLKRPSEALAAAARAVGRVLRSGAYSNVVVDQEASRSADPGRVRALAFQAIRHLPAIDQAIARASSRPVDEIDPLVLDLLRVGAADLRSDRPAPVVVDTTVEAVRGVASRAAGFANAVMRRLAAAPPSWGPTVPEWLDEKLRRALGEDEARRFWEASLEAPLVGLRLRPGATPPEGASPVEGIPGAFLWPGGEPGPGSIVQDPASVAVVVAAEPARARRTLEVGAAPGGKTLHLLDETSGEVVALDAHPRRGRSAARRVPGAHWVIADGRRPPFGEGAFDLVLIDAPCSGLGTLRRRPEILLRVTEEEVARLSAVQRALVDAAIPLLSPGGRLVYSVCTVTPEETVEVVAGWGFGAPARLPGRRWGDGILLAPHVTGTDGMFIAVRR